MKKILKNWIIPIFHLAIIIFLWTCSWYVPWFYVILIFVVYRIQLKAFNGCILSHAQFGNKEEGFYYHYLSKIYPKIKNSAITLVVDNIIPAIIIIMAYVIQTKF